ncbi:hypothetical protein LNTAR_22105 [Lentisphaera araneosa HTCC2155]|uniref:Uncharacterized protein n=1 Tax=Lentisphaera araneosa HTCC2155 TaxID=313628 RepID=A6DSN2_9BACT|nr:type II secretion system protein [Lentisphaera araneosa]EDM25385.1 hypothetical protein LNTAR_22105 [Lentisphaera araneosa HTCC2155]
MNKNKFTLIELLVVVSIIGILASLLLPALSSARDKSKLAVCKSNMRQIQVAYQMYFDDNDGYYPTDSPQMSWDDRLNGYDGRNVPLSDLNSAWPLEKSLYNSEIYACPDDEISRIWGVDTDVLTLSYSPTTYMYYVNAGSINSSKRGITGFNWKGALDGYASSKISEINQASSTISTFEHMTEGRCLGRDDQSSVSPESFFLSTANVPHEGFNKSNFLFVDGHVESLNAYSTLSIDGGGMGSDTNTTGTMWDAHR